MEREIVNTKFQLDALAGNTTADVANLSRRLEELNNEKTEATKVVHKQRKELEEREKALFDRNSELEKATLDIKRTSELVQYAMSHLESGRETFEKQATQGLARIEERLQSVQVSLD